MDLFRLARYSGCALLLLLMVSCDVFAILFAPLDPESTLDEIERRVRLRNDTRAVFTYDEYRELMQELAGEHYMVLPMDSFRITFDTTRIVVGMRHDIDCHPFNALEMADIENSFGMQSTYYILHSAEYYGTASEGPFVRFAVMDTIYRQLAEKAGEIGVHNNLIEMMTRYDIEPLSFQLEEIEYYAALDIPIYGSAAHGSEDVTELGLSNRMIYADFSEYGTFDYRGKTYEYGRYSLGEFGFQYEALAIDYDKFISDSGGRWSISGVNDQSHDGSLGVAIQALQSFEPGDRVQILTHPVWWGRE